MGHGGFHLLWVGRVGEGLEAAKCYRALVDVCLVTISDPGIQDGVA